MAEKLLSQLKHRSRNKRGMFTRTVKEWSLTNFNDGYVDGTGRFRVYLPNHPRAYGDGYILRAIVAYEAYNGGVVSKNDAIHHKNKNRLDDSKDNLEKLPFGEHSYLHLFKNNITKRICKICGSEFYIKTWMLNQKDWKRGSYCSRNCYNRRGSKKCIKY